MPFLIKITSTCSPIHIISFNATVCMTIPFNDIHRAQQRKKQTNTNEKQLNWNPLTDDRIACIRSIIVLNHFHLIRFWFLVSMFPLIKRLITIAMQTHFVLMFQSDWNEMAAGGIRNRSQYLLLHFCPMNQRWQIHSQNNVFFFLPFFSVRIDDTELIQHVQRLRTGILCTNEINTYETRLPL